MYTLYLTRASLQEGGASSLDEKELQQIFDEFDVNGDGTIQVGVVVLTCVNECMCAEIRTTRCYAQDGTESDR